MSQVVKSSISDSWAPHHSHQHLQGIGSVLWGMTLGEAIQWLGDTVYSYQISPYSYIKQVICIFFRKCASTNNNIL